MSEATVTAAVVGGDAWCARCGYNLRGLAEEGRCPECGMAVRESLERRGLEAASGRELRLARRGLWVMAGASAVGLLVSIGALLATFGTGWMMARMSTGSSASHLTVNMILWLIVGWVGIAVSGVNGLGMFWATTPGRGGGVWLGWLRWPVRGLTGLALLLGLTQTVVYSVMTVTFLSLIRGPSSVSTFDAYGKAVEPYQTVLTALMFAGTLFGGLQEVALMVYIIVLAWRAGARRVGVQLAVAGAVGALLSVVSLAMQAVQTVMMYRARVGSGGTRSYVDTYLILGYVAGTSAVVRGIMTVWVVVLLLVLAAGLKRVLRRVAAFEGAVAAAGGGG